MAIFNKQYKGSENLARELNIKVCKWPSYPSLIYFILQYTHINLKVKYFLLNNKLNKPI